jgi:hypothetical protein
MILIEGSREATGGGEWEPNQILLQELAYVLSSTPKPKHYKKVMNAPTHHRNDPLEVMNAAEKE